MAWAEESRSGVRCDRVDGGGRGPEQPPTASSQRDSFDIATRSTLSPEWFGLPSAGSSEMST